MNTACHLVWHVQRSRTSPPRLNASWFDAKGQRLLLNARWLIGELFQHAIRKNISRILTIVVPKWHLTLGQRIRDMDMAQN